MRTSVVRSPICLWCVRPGQTIFSSLSALFLALVGLSLTHSLAWLLLLFNTTRARMFCNPARGRRCACRHWGGRILRL